MPTFTENELQLLNRYYRSGKTECIVVYGRRRVGKTSLINEFAAGKRTIYFTAIKANVEDNLKLLSKAIAEYGGQRAEEIVYHASFDEAFNAVSALAKKNKTVFIIRNFEYLPSKQPEPEPSPSPSPEQKPSDQQAGNNNSQPSSDNNSEKKQETQAVTSAVSETVSTSVSETVDTSVTVSETSVSESETAVTSVSETEVIDETTAVFATTVTEEISEEKKENKNRSIYLAGVAIIATILGVAGAYSIRHNKK